MSDLTSGRTLTKWNEVTGKLSDVVIASERLDRQDHQGLDFAHSTFVNVSFLGATLKDSTFLDCTFIQCYFRDTTLEQSTFVGCKFVDSNFHGATVRASNFRYAHFRRSVIPYAEMQYSAPSEPNLRFELFQDLSRSALALGDEDNSRKYRLGAIEAQNEHLWAAVKHESQWYKEHFPWDRRVGAALQLAWHFINKWLWRHGESTRRLLLTALVTTLLIFPLVMMIWKPDGVGFTDLMWLSTSNLLSLDRLSSIEATSGALRIVSALEGLVGIAFAGLVVTLILKALLRR